MKEGGEQVKLMVKIKYIHRTTQAMLVLYVSPITDHLKLIVSPF